MIINDDWRLTPSLEAFVLSGIDSPMCYLSPSDKPQYKNAVIKTIPGSYKEVHIDSNEFELKFCGSYPFQDLSVFVKSGELPSKDWYRIMNFQREDMVKFFLELNSSRGEFPGELFEAIFSETNPTKVSFSCPHMSNHKVYMEELRRRLNCELSRKTKKWVAGHRYDTLKETYYYLGSVMSRRKDGENDSLFLDDTGMVEVHLYTNTKEDSDTSISDILRTRTFGNTKTSIKTITAIPTAVDCGEELINDLGDDIRVYWDTMLDNAEKQLINYSPCGEEIISETKRYFDVLCYMSAGKLDYPKEIANRVFKFAERVFDNLLIRYWDLSTIRKDMTINSSNTKVDNIEALVKILIFDSGDLNISRYQYYNDMFARIGVDLRAAAGVSLDNWSVDNLSETFDTFVKHSDYFDRRKNQGDITSRQRVSTTTYKLDVIKLADLFGEGSMLTNTLIEIVKFAKNNFGAGVSEYLTYNCGTKKKPLEYSSIVITLGDIISWYKGAENIDVELKAEIMNKLFTRVYVIIDNDREVE